MSTEVIEKNAINFAPTSTIVSKIYTVHIYLKDVLMRKVNAASFIILVITRHAHGILLRSVISVFINMLLLFNRYP